LLIWVCSVGVRTIADLKSKKQENSYKIHTYFVSLSSL